MFPAIQHGLRRAERADLDRLFWGNLQLGQYPIYLSSGVEVIEISKLGGRGNP